MKKRLSTNARPLDIETLSAEEAAKVNGGMIFGLIVNPSPSPTPTPEHHRRRKHHPIYGLIINK